jgi:hypothetical protein
MRGARRNVLNNIIHLGFLRNVDRISAQLDARRLIVKLAEASDLLPSSLKIHGVDHRSVDPLFGGTFGDIYRAQYQGNSVALKRLRLFQTDIGENLQARRVGLFDATDDITDSFSEILQRGAYMEKLGSRTCPALPRRRLRKLSWIPLHGFAVDE